MIPTSHFLILSGLLFSIGLAIVLSRKHIIVVLMGLELMFNAANINLVAFGRNSTGEEAQLFALFVIVVAAAESAIALAIVLRLYREFKSVELDKIDSLREPNS